MINTDTDTNASASAKASADANITSAVANNTSAIANITITNASPTVNNDGTGKIMRSVVNENEESCRGVARVFEWVLTLDRVGANCHAE